MKKINICYSPDNNYAIPCAISIHSVLQKIKQSTEVEIYILDGGLKNKSKQVIAQIVDLYQFANLTFIPVDDEEYKDFHTDAWKTSATYRFNVDSLLFNLNKVLYIDCDIIADKSIEELYNTDLEDNIIGMIPDIWYKKQLKRFPNKKQPYFNTGVCLFNLEEWRKEDISKKLITYYNENVEKIIYPDQDPINVILDTRIKELEYKYNWCWHWEKNEYFEENGNVSIEDAILIHYIFSKPWWSTNIHIASNKYFDAVRSIPKKIRKEYKKYYTNICIEKCKIYLFCLIPIMKKKNYFSQVYYSLFGFIPILKILKINNKKKYYLFNLLPILKIKNSNYLKTDLEVVQDGGKY